jgi:hypothetical protein
MCRRKPRMVLALVLCCLAFGQVAPAFEASVAAPEKCGQSCPGEESGDPCDPLCDVCACCSFAPQISHQTIGSVPLLLPTRHHSVQASSPLSPDPSEILHVPRLVLA